MAIGGGRPRWAGVGMSLLSLDGHEPDRQPPRYEADGVDWLALAAAECSARPWFARAAPLQRRLVH
eukprot:363755-Chlamydomonas_euryale.AAC.1